jgi:hypothetical protein
MCPEWTAIEWLLGLDSMPLGRGEAESRATEDRPRATNERAARLSGSSGWTRTSNPPVNSVNSDLLPLCVTTCFALLILPSVNTLRLAR